MNDILAPSLAFIAAFLIGSIPFAVIVSKCMGLEDPRSYGSGNPGATNVLRSGNKLAALLTLVGDALKGLFAVLVAKWLAASLGLDTLSLALVALGVFLGHVFSVFLRFRGGKGVATAAGVLFGIDWRLGMCTSGVWLLIAIATRYSSLAALCAAIMAPLFAWWLSHDALWAGMTTAMAALLVWRHQSNIRKLLAGEEGKIGKKKTQAST